MSRTWRRVELGSQVYDQWCEIGGQPAAALAVFQLPGANALEVATKVKRRWNGSSLVPRRRRNTRSRSTRPIFVDESIHEVYKTLFEAGVLVLDRDPGVPPGLAGGLDPARQPCP